MSFESFGDFLSMGGHGLYVWMSYGASVIVVLTNVIAVKRARSRAFREARALGRRLATAGGGTSENSDNPIPVNPERASER